MTINKRLLESLVLGELLLGASVFANASTSFNFTTQSLNPSSANGGGSLSETVGGVTVTETAYWVNANNSGSNVTGTSNDFSRSWLGAYSGNGLGACNPNEQPSCASPQHQIDNYNGMDFVLLSLSSVVNIGDLGVASFGNPTGSGSDDVDMSYAILTSNQETSLLAGTLSLGSVSFTTDTSSDLASDTYDINASGQYLLIGAAVTAKYGGDSTADAFKIQNLSFTPNTATPEPASFFLIGSGLLAGVAFGRRRLNRK